MPNKALKVHEAVKERNYQTSSQLIEQTIIEGRLPGLISGLEEIERAATRVTLELRDHVFYYLGMWDIYYAVQMSSTEVLQVLYDNSVHENSRSFMVDFIRGLAEKKDNRFDQFCVNIQTISRSQYAILIPTILEQRTEELLRSRIQYKSDTPRYYCTADLLDTYYGRKIVTAIHGHRMFDIVVDEEQFGIISESLASTGLDVDSMLENVPSDEWNEYVSNRRRTRTSRFTKESASPRTEEISELRVLHRVKSARSNIYSDAFVQQNAALQAIDFSKTQLCNDVLSDIATSPSHPLRIRALKHLGESGDSQTLELLNNIMKNGETTSIRREAARAYSALSSKTAGMGLLSPPPTTTPPAVDIAEINSILHNLIDRGMPTTMIEEVLYSVTLQSGTDATDLLLKLFSHPNERIRLGIVKVSKQMDRENAALILHVALQDESDEIVKLAERELDTRWSDEVW